MVNRIHTFVIGVTPSTNIQNEMNTITENLKHNVGENKGLFTEFVTATTKRMAQEEMSKFTFKGDLRRAVARKAFKKTGRGEVFIKDTEIQKAIMNEFGQEPPIHYGVDKPISPKLREWANAKGWDFKKSPTIKVGFPGGRSRVIAPNPANRFWSLTANRVNAKIDQIFADYIEIAIKES